MVSLHDADAEVYLNSLGDASVDLVLTDPPYEAIEKHRKVGTTTRLKVSQASSNPWFKFFPDSRMGALLSEIYRVLKPNRHFYMFCGPETMFVVKPLAEAAGFKFWKPLVWDKMKLGMGYHYRCRYEFILFFEKGKRKLNYLGTPDILRHEVPRQRGRYPTEKPVDLLKTLILQSTQKSELVCDPFFGSGSAAVASIDLGRSFTGTDINPDAHAYLASRLDANNR